MEPAGDATTPAAGEPHTTPPGDLQKGNAIMTPRELKQKYKSSHPTGTVFHPKRLTILGDTMKNFGVRDAGNRVVAGSPDKVEVWELFRKNQSKKGLTGPMFFAKDDFRVVYVLGEDW